MSADGRWSVTLQSPMGPQAMTLVLETAGSALSGSLESPMGTQPFDGGTAEGDALAWSVSITQPMAMTLEFEATVDGDVISGNAKLGSFGTATFEGSREG
jgi:hypothetical protein